MSRRPRRIALVLAKIGLAALLLGWLLATMDIRRVLRISTNLPAETYAFVAVATGAQLLAQFSVQHTLLNWRREVSFTRSAKIDLVMKLSNLLMPSKASGYVALPVLVTRTTAYTWVEAAAIVAFDLSLYSLLYGLTAMLGLLFVVTSIPTYLFPLFLLAIGLYTAVGFAVISAVLQAERLAAGGRGLRRHLPLLPLLIRGGTALLTRFRAATGINQLQAEENSHRAIREGFLAMLGDRRLTAIYFLGVVGTVMIFPGLRVYALLAAMGSAGSWVPLLPVLVVLIYSVTLLPLTPGGIGVAEVTGALVLVALGVPEAVAAMVVLIDRMAGIYLPALAGIPVAADLGVSAIASDEG